MTDELTYESPGQLLRAFEHRAKKRFGQHFLVDPSILASIVAAAKIEPGDRVLEIGPGCGTLTLTLLQAGAEVRAVEVDRDAIAFLTHTLVPQWPLTIVEGDVLRHDLSEILEPGERPWKGVANLPYNIATEIFFRLVEVAERWQCMVLMFQKEVAKRFVARTGDKAYGVLSLMCQLHCDAEIVLSLPPGAFVPPPKVHSAVIRFTPVAGTRIPDEELRARFVRVVKTAFQARRKTLPNALKGLGLEKERVLEAIESVGLDVRVRPEVVSFEQFVALTAKLDALT